MGNGENWEIGRRPKMVRLGKVGKRVGEHWETGKSRQTMAVVAVPVDALEPLRDDEFLNVRVLAG